MLAGDISFNTSVQGQGPLELHSHLWKNDFSILLAQDHASSDVQLKRYFEPSRRTLHAGMPVALLGFPASPPTALYGGSGGARLSPSISIADLMVYYSHFADVSISVGHLVEVHTSGLLLHSAPQLEGQSGGVLIALDDYFQANVLTLAHEAHMPFIGIATAGTDFGQCRAVHRASRVQLGVQDGAGTGRGGCAGGRGSSFDRSCGQGRCSKGQGGGEEEGRTVTVCAASLALACCCSAFACHSQLSCSTCHCMFKISLCSG
jgi:hypothetical protein